MRAILAALVMAFCVMSAAVAGPLEDGAAAYARQDYALAVQWYRKAADQGNADAQFNLGVMYANGQGVLQDYVTAHKWFNLAVSGLSASETTQRNAAVTYRDRVAARMTPAQIAEAQRLAREWKPTGGAK